MTARAKTAKTTYQHSWRLMAAGALLFAVGFPVALANGSYLLAVSSFIGLGVLALLWLTVDPPGVEDSDCHGPRA
jgi:hypothetical protein